MPRGSGNPYVFDARSARWGRTTGWERYTRELARRLRTDQDVLVRESGSESLASRFWGDLVDVPLALRSARVVHFPTLPPAPWAVRRAAVVFTLHDLTWWRYPQTSSRLGRHYYRPFAEATLKRAHVVTGTRAMAEEIQEEFDLPQDQITVVPLGSALPAPDGTVHRKRPFVLAVGTVEPRKNLGALGRAYGLSSLAGTHDLVIAGRGGWGEPPPGVTVISGLNDQELSNLYASASALVLPSLYEGFGLPVIEAMQLGVPVICSDTPVLREVSGGHATFIDPNDVDSIAAGLDQVPDLNPQPEAASWARARWSWDAAAMRLRALYRELDGVSVDDM